MPERTVSSTHAYRGKLISLRIDEVEMESGRHATREVVEHPGAVAILAWDGERLAMVSQWRQAAQLTMLEIPAGTLDPGEAPEATARRELAEEVSLAAATWEQGPSFFTAPGFSTERLSLFLATDLEPAEAQADDDEAIEGSWLTLDEALAAIDDGRIVDAKSLAGILWLGRRLA
ncbi:MAG TPA: NUDIX hydrolase [Candidatus Limnocylindria bacterium]|jgi:ADP-ribose pyrophosphatase|nr:NUDIX hydrolase [Candidatus Limnocylindria bacterium]